MNEAKKKERIVKGLSIAIISVAGLIFVLHIVAIILVIIAFFKINDPETAESIAKSIIHGYENSVNGGTINLGQSSTELIVLFQQGLRNILLLTILFVVLNAISLTTGILGICLCKNPKKNTLIFVANIISAIITGLLLNPVLLILHILNAVFIKQLDNARKNLLTTETQIHLSEDNKSQDKNNTSSTSENKLLKNAKEKFKKTFKKESKQPSPSHGDDAKISEDKKKLFKTATKKKKQSSSGTTNEEVVTNVIKASDFNNLPVAETQDKKKANTQTDKQSGTDSFDMLVERATDSQKTDK